MDTIHDNFVVIEIHLYDGDVILILIDDRI